MVPHAQNYIIIGARPFLNCLLMAQLWSCCTIEDLVGAFYAETD